VITADGSNGYKAEPGRYVLYVTGACPWCHRVMITIQLKGLEDIIELVFVDPVMGEIEPGKMGWVFSSNYKDPLFKSKNMMQIYRKGISHYSGKATVPLLWDKKTSTIVNNESSDIIKFLNNQFNHLPQTKNPNFNLRPNALLDKIESQGEWLLHNLNDRVYRTGFATSQTAYESNAKELWKTLDSLEAILSKQRYILGTFTEVDIRAFVTLIRFDAVYTIHFKCVRKIEEYPNLRNYLRELYQIPKIKGTVRMDEIRNHYFRSHLNINPNRIVALFETNYDEGHNRDKSFPNQAVRISQPQAKL